MSSTWNGTSGNWATPTQWSNGVPGVGDEAIFNTGNFTVTFNTTDQLATIYGFDTGARFAVTGGSLDVSGWSWNGGFLLSAGTLNITGNSPSWTTTEATISGGALILAPASGTSAYFAAGLDQTGGTIALNAGQLILGGAVSVLDGTVTGAGTLDIAGSTAVTLGNAVVLDIANLDIATNGSLILAPGSAGTQDYTYDGNIDANFDSTLNSNGQILTLGKAGGKIGGGTFGASFTGGGTLDVLGNYDVGGLTIAGANGLAVLSGSEIQDANAIDLGPDTTSNDTLVIAAGGLLNNAGGGAIDGNKLSTLDIRGTLAVSTPLQGSAVLVAVEDLTLASGGTLFVAGNSAADLQGPSAAPSPSALLLGTVAGAGTLQIGGYETASVGGTALDQAYLEIGSYLTPPGELLLTAAQNYNGDLVAGDGIIDTNGFVFTLGSLSRGTLSNTINGGGTMVLGGTLELDGPSLTGAGSELLITGLAYQAAANVNLAGAAGVTTELSIGSTGTLNMTAPNWIYGTGTADVNNAGLIEVTGDTTYNGPEFYDTNFTNSGTVDVQIGTLELFSGNATLGGVFEGQGGLLLDGATVTLLGGLSLDTSYLQWIGAHITLAGNFDYGNVLVAGNNTTINTEGHTLSVAAGALDAVVTGGGTVVVDGRVDGGPGGFDGGALILEGTGTTLLDDYIINQDANELELGAAATDSTTLNIATGAQYILSGWGGIASNSGTNSVIINHGTFQEASIYPLEPPEGVYGITVGTFDNLGTINDTSGGIDFVTSLVNDGLINVGQNMQISGQVTADAGDAGTFVIGTGATLGFTGGILTNPVPGSLVAASQIVSFGGANGFLSIENPALFAGTIEGFAAGDVIEVGVVPDSTGLPNTFVYAHNQLTLESVTEISAGTYATAAVGILNLPGINPADLQLFYNDVNGQIDIELSNPASGDAPFAEDRVYNATWTSTAPADWNTPGDWDTQIFVLPTQAIEPVIENVLPPSDYDIILAADTVLDFTSLSTGGVYVANTFLGQTGSTFNLASGTLVTTYGFDDSASVNIVAGTLEQISGAEVGLPLIGTLDLGTAGVLQIDDGDLEISGAAGTSDTIAGTLAGLGALALKTGTYSIAGSADLAIATLAIAGGDVILEGNQTFAGQTLSDASILNLNGNNLLLPKDSLLALTGGTVTGGGTITVAGMADLGGLITGAGTEILITGTAQNGYGPVELGSLAASSNVATAIVVAQGGTYFNPSFVQPSGEWSGTLINNGFIEQTSPLTPYDEVGQQEQLELFVNSATGTLDINAGNMVFDFGGATLDGVIEGAGTFELSAEVATLYGSADLAVANVVLASTTLTLEGSQAYLGNFVFTFGDINLNSHVLDLGGNEDFNSTGTLEGSVSGGGTLVLGGEYYAYGLDIAGSGTELLDTGYLAVTTGGLQLGESSTDSTSFTIASGGDVNVMGGSEGAFGAARVVNNGLVEDSGTGNVSWAAASFINTGTMAIDYGQFGVNATSASLGGLVTGAGTLALTSNANVTLAAGVTLDVATLALESGQIDLGGNITYGGAFIGVSNPTLNTNGDTLDLTGGGTLEGYISGGGEVLVAGTMLASSTYLWSANTTLGITGTLEVSSGEIYAGSTNAVGAGAQVDISGTGVLDFAQDGAFGTLGTFDNLTIGNAGLIEKTGDTGVMTISATSFLNTGTIAALAGTIDITGLLVNDGTIFEDGLGNVATGSLTGTGKIIIDPAAATLSGAIGAGQTIDFSGSGGTLVLADAAQFLGTIAGFAAGDIIDLSAVAPGAITAETFANGTLTLVAGSTFDIAFADPSSFSLPLMVATDGASGSYITEAALCYLAGTRILTLGGEVPVETLRAGDLVVTRFGATRPVKWIGRQSYDSRFLQKNAAKIPVRIAAGALGAGLPARDLYVSPGHSILLGEVLVLASSLVNGITITQPAPAGLVEYFNIDFGTHDCVLAEGIWAESYADMPGMRQQFHNAAEYAALFPDDMEPAQLCLCAPRPEHGAALQAALRPIAARAAAGVQTGDVSGFIDVIAPGEIAGWAIDRAHPELPLLLEVRLDDRVVATVLACGHRGDLAAAGLGRGHCAFHLEMLEEVPPQDLPRIRVFAPDLTELSMTDACQAAVMSGQAIRAA